MCIYGFDREKAPIFRIPGIKRSDTDFYLIRQSTVPHPHVLGVGKIDGRWYETVASPEDVQWARRPEEMAKL